MRRDRNIWERITKQIDLTTEPAPKQPLVELYGQKRALIENHCGVTGYGSTEICVKVRYGQIVLCGNCLELTRMTKDQLVVTGTIDSVRFCKGGK